MRKARMLPERRQRTGGSPVPRGWSRAAPGGVCLEVLLVVFISGLVTFASWRHIDTLHDNCETGAATTQPVTMPATAPAAKPAKTELDYWLEALDYVWLRETRCGQDPFPAVGPLGEEGEYQIRPIFIEDVERFYGYTIDPHNNASCRWGVYLWFKHYAPRVGIGYRQKFELYRLYNMGATGYREWKGNKP